MIVVEDEVAMSVSKSLNELLLGLSQYCQLSFWIYNLTNPKNFHWEFIMLLKQIYFIAELWRAKRACGAPWVSKSTHPRKFGNHVTVHRPQPARPSAPQGNQCSISHFLAS